MIAEIITIGDEILNGDVLDTNARYLAGHCRDLGMTVQRHTSVRDDAKAIASVLIKASERADTALVTGGLGPTADDITIESAAQAFGVELIEDAAVIARMAELFRARSRPFTPNNRRQAMVPRGAEVFLNEVGTAPGVFFKAGRCGFYFFPGVPRELEFLFARYALPRLKAVARPSAMAFLRAFGATESMLDEALRPLLTGPMEIDGVRIGFRASFPETFIRLSVTGDTPEEAQARLGPVLNNVETRIGPHVYARDAETTIEKALLAELTARGKTLALAESCTGGAIAHRVTNVPGSSGVFRGGVVAYGNDFKTRVLGVPAELLDRHGAVSAECAEAMARGVKNASSADYCAAVTGIAGPGGGSPGKPVGLVHIAWLFGDDIEAKEFHFPFPRVMFKELVAATVFHKLLRRLRKNRPEG